MDTGHSFGEKALMSKDKRSATILTNTYCEFLVIMREDFLMISKNWELEQKKKRAFILKTIPLLDKIK